MTNRRTVVLIRGASNSGKSSFAQYLQWAQVEDLSCVICTADDFMMENGEYKFDFKKLGFVHQQCRLKFINALENEINLVIVANTNTKYSDFNYYIENAQKYGYKVFSIVMEKRFEGGDNGHGVPEKTLEKQEKEIIESLKLR